MLYTKWTNRLELAEPERCEAIEGRNSCTAARARSLPRQISSRTNSLATTDLRSTMPDQRIGPNVIRSPLWSVRLTTAPRSSPCASPTFDLENVTNTSTSARMDNSPTSLFDSYQQDFTSITQSITQKLNEDLKGGQSTSSMLPLSPSLTMSFVVSRSPQSLPSTRRNRAR